MKPLSAQPGAHQDLAVGENPDIEVLLHDLVTVDLQLVPKEGVGSPDAVPAGQGEEGGGVVSGESQSGVLPLLPGKGGGRVSKTCNHAIT